MGRRWGKRWKEREKFYIKPLSQTNRCCNLLHVWITSWDLQQRPALVSSICCSQGYCPCTWRSHLSSTERFIFLSFSPSLLLLEPWCRLERSWEGGCSGYRKCFVTQDRIHLWCLPSQDMATAPRHDGFRKENQNIVAETLFIECFYP